MRIILIRHGKTRGNTEKRYISTSDEPLLRSAAEELESMELPHCDLLFSSPARRCIQTAEIIFPGVGINICDDLREIDFGDFEGKNYEELNGDPAYQRWIDSGGTIAFPNGESLGAFRDRTCAAFLKCISAADEDITAAFVVHGGTIMSVMDRFAVPHKDYFDWRVDSAHGFVCAYDRSKNEITVIEKI